ncbi:MAG: DHH family phosphoesterase [Lachnospirales bacterium]
MKLKNFLKYNNIVVLSHNIPDSDSICSGFALSEYFKLMGKSVKFIYGGYEKITKTSLIILINELNIDIEFTNTLPLNTELLITVDSQYGAGNVTKYDDTESVRIVTLDHHKVEIKDDKDTLILPQYGSCTTLIYKLLLESGFNIHKHHDILNALYYGIYTDSNGLSELRHPLDRDLAEVDHDEELMRKLRNAAIAQRDLDIISKILTNRIIINKIALFHAEPCDPNLLGFTADITQQVAGIDCCILFAELEYGTKLSIRSCTNEIMAHEMADYMCRGIGSGGGNRDKSGGFISLSKFEEVYPNYTMEDYLKWKINEYNASNKFVYYPSKTTFKNMKKYKKKPSAMGFLKATDLSPKYSTSIIRTIEGDIKVFIEDDLYLLVDQNGKIIKIKEYEFKDLYEPTEEEYIITPEYIPTTVSKGCEYKVHLLSLCKGCIQKKDEIIEAQVLEENTKIFIDENRDKYFFGRKGDFILLNHTGVDVISQDIFNDKYVEL